MQHLLSTNFLPLTKKPFAIQGRRGLRGTTLLAGLQAFRIPAIRPLSIAITGESLRRLGAMKPGCSILIHRRSLPMKATGEFGPGAYMRCTPWAPCRAHTSLSRLAGRWPTTPVLAYWICVDPVGFEPTTFSMPLRRAPNCAMGPGLRVTELYPLWEDSSTEMIQVSI